MAEDTRPPLTVALTGLNAVDSPGPGVAVARALRESADYNVRLVGLSYENLEPGIYLRELFDKTYSLPYPAAGTGALLERLAYIKAQENVAVIIPNFDSELVNFIEVAPELAKRGIATFLPTMEMLNLRDKAQLPALGAALGFGVPATVAVSSAAAAVAAAETLGWPLVLKGKLYDARVAHTAAEAGAAFAALAGRWGLPLLAQRFAAGQELNVAGLGDGRGGLLSAVAMRKLFITDKGKAWAGITIMDDALMALAAAFVAGTKWRGGFELEVMRAGNGELLVLEINPRFPAWVYLAAAAGNNQPAALLRLALGEAVGPLGAYAAGKLFVRYAWDQIVDYTDFQQMAGMGEL